MSGMRTGNSLQAGHLEFVWTLAAPEENNARFVNRLHNHFMKEFVPALRTSPRMQGKGAVVPVHSVHEE
jgi:hypothetical protein